MNQHEFPSKFAAFGYLILGIFLPYFLIVLIIQDPESLLSGNNRYYIFMSEIFIILPPLIYLRSKSFSIKKVLRIRSAPLHVLAVSLLTGIAISILGDEIDRLISYFISPPEWISESFEIFQITSFTDFIFIFGGIAIIAPIAEELLFRGFLQTSLEYQNQNILRAVLITSLAFSLLHMNTFWVVQIYIFGMVLSYYSWRSQSVLPGIFIHTGINGTSILLTNLEISNQLGWYEIGEHVSPVWIAVSAFAVYYGFKTLTETYPLDTRQSDTIIPPDEGNP